MKKRILSAVLTLCMVLTLLPAAGLTAGAESTGQFQAIMDAAKDRPAGFGDDDSNPYGHGKGEAFLLNEENELMLFQTCNIDKNDQTTRAWTTWYNKYDPGTIKDNIASGTMDLAVNNYKDDKGGFGFTAPYNDTQRYCYVQGTAFDPTGSGRRDHVAYVGYLPPETAPDTGTPGGSTPTAGVYVWVLNTVSGEQSGAVFLNTLVVPEDFNQYQSGAMLSITAGRYGNGTKEHFIVYSQGEDKGQGSVQLYGLREYSYDSQKKELTREGHSLEGLHERYVKDADGRALAASMSSGEMNEIGQRLYASLATGDFNGDGVDDLAMVSYLGQPHDSKFKNLHREYYEPYLSVIYGGDDMLLDNGSYSVYLAEDGTTDKDGKRTDTSMASPGIACGDIDGDGEDEIVAAGYQNAIKLKENSADADEPYKIDQANLLVAAYNAGSADNAGHVDKKPAKICFEPCAANGWTKGGLSTGDNIWQPVGVACAAVNGKGMEEYVFLSGDLGIVNDTGFVQSYRPAYFDSTDNAAGGSVINRAYLSSVAVGNFDDNRYGREQAAFSVGLKQEGADDYHFMLGIAGGHNYGNAPESSGDKAGYGAQAASLYSSDIEKAKYLIAGKGDDHKEKLNCFLVAVDNDDTAENGSGDHNGGKSDGQLARYAGKSYAYSDPTVQAVLQAAPYFGELGGYDDFGDGSTSYSASNSYGMSLETTTEKSFGIGTTSELSMPGIKVGMERGYTASWSKSFETSFTETWTDTFTAGAYDKAVLQRTPVFIYLYEAFRDGQWTSATIPDGTQDKDVAGYLNKNTIQVSIPKKPTYYTMSVDKYNEFADFYNAQEGVGNEKGKAAPLKKLEDKNLGSEGNPWGYRDGWNGGDGAESLSKEGSYALGHSSGSITSAYERTDGTTAGVSQSNSFSFGLTVSTGAMFGLGEVWGGVSSSFEYSDGYGKYESQATSEGTSGTVCDLDDPGGSVLSDYVFNWSFGKWNCDLGGAGTKVPIFGYALNGIVAPVASVTDLEAETAGEGAVNLTWTKPGAIGGRPEAAAYNVYYLKKNGGYIPLNTAPVADLAFTADGLDSNTEYTFVVASLDEDGKEGIRSNEAVITTPRQNFPVSLTVDDDGAVSVTASHLGNKPIADGDKVPEETIVYVVITPAEGSVVTGVTLDMGGKTANIDTTDGKFNFALKGGASISVTTAPIAADGSYVSYEPRDPAAEPTAPPDSEMLRGTLGATVSGYELDPSGAEVKGAVEFTARPEPGYVLQEWKITTNTTGSPADQDERTIVAAGKDTLTFYPYAEEHKIKAVFVEEGDPSVLRTVTVQPSAGGSVVVTDGQGQTLEPNEEGKITVLRGRQLVFRAEAEKWYSLEGWTDAFSDYRNAAGPIERSVLEDMTVGAEFFTPMKFPVTFSAVSMDSGSGTLTAATADGTEIETGAKLVPEAEADFTAAANTGSRLRKWGITVGDVETFEDLDASSDDLITADKRRLAIELTTDVKAYFKEIEKLAVTISTPENGSITVTGPNGQPVTSGGKLPYGSKLTIAATAEDSYRLSSLTVNGVAFTSGGSYALTGDITVDAAFSERNSGGGGGTSYSLTFETNGGSAVDSVSESGGAVIDLSDYLPTREGYSFSGWYSDEALTEEVASLELTEDTTVYAKWAEALENPFDDVPDGAYYYDAVLWAADKGVTSGTSATTFSPGTVCTRAQTVTFLWRAMGSPEPASAANPFTDVSADAYSYKAILWAAEKGITKGTSKTTFSPNKNCTRAQVVTLLHRTAGEPAVTAGESFTDVPASAYYAQAVAWAVKEEITKGTSSSTFSPNSGCTRAQIVTFLYRHLGK